MTAPSWCVCVRSNKQNHTVVVEKADATVQDVIEAYLKGNPGHSTVLMLKGKELSPSDRLDALDMTEYDYLEVKPPQIKCSLPRRTDIDTSEMKPPENYDELLQELKDLGLQSLDEEQLKEALINACYNVNRAAEYALAMDGQRPPEVRRNPLAPEDRQWIKDVASELGQETVEVLQIFEACDRNREQTMEILKGK